MSTENIPSDLTTLEAELKSLIVDTLKLEDVSPEDIETTGALFGTGLGLDSIDALEIGIAIRKKYGIKFDAQDENMQKNFSSVQSLAQFIMSARS